VKKRFSILTLVSLAIIMMAYGTITSFANTGSKPLYNSTHVVFSESFLSNGEMVTNEHEVWFNDKGEYRMNTISGPYAGDYEVWDGKIHYQYTKETNILVVREHDHAKGLALPHVIFSKSIINRIHDDIKTEKFQKKEFVQLLNLKTQKLTKTNKLTQIHQEAKEQNPGLYRQGINSSTQQIFMNPKNKMVLKSVSYINDTVTHEIVIKKLEPISEFDGSILTVNEPTAFFKNLSK
jgi:hypothetical protein